MSDQMVGTDQNRQLLSTKDWYFSDLHHRLLIEYYAKNQIELPNSVKSEYKIFDKLSNHSRRIEKIIEKTENRTPSCLLSPNDSTSTATNMNQ